MWSLSSWKFMTRKIPNHIIGQNIKKNPKKQTKTNKGTHKRHMKYNSLS